MMNFGKYGKKEPTGFKRKLVKFFEKQGFYVVLAACLLIIAVSAVLTTTIDNNPDDSALNPTPELSPKAAQYVENNKPNISPSIYEYPGYGSEQQVIAPTEAAVEESPEASEQTEKKIIELPRPCDGEVSTRFSKDSLIYNTTLDQWTTHLGIDILGEEGADVKAVAAGSVEKITDDAMMGGMVVVKHETGNKTIYAGMADLPAELKEGVKVTRGMLLGHVGNTAIAEYDLGAHLHFEYIVSGKAVDPLKYISGYKLSPTAAPSASPSESPGVSATPGPTPEQTISNAE